jgi:hypothetical protein
MADVILNDISGGAGIPKRQLIGSERGELASSQDESNFLGTVAGRQEHDAEPGILRPVLDRLIATGVLPEPEGGSYTVEWPSLFELTEEEQSQVALNLAQALKNAAPMGDPGTFLDDEQILRFIDAPDEIIDEVREQLDDMPDDDDIEEPPEPPADDEDETDPFSDDGIESLI